LRAGPASIIAFLAALFAGTSVLAQSPPRKIGELELTLGGISATVTPSNPTIPKNIASGVQIVVTSGGATLTPAQVAQFLGGPFQITGVLSGPGLSQPVNVPQPGTGSGTNSLILLLPTLTEGGNYTLSNLQFVVNGNDALDVSPSSVTINCIDQVLVTSVQTQALTLAQIQAAGIVLDSSDVVGFNFTIGLQLSSQVVNISFPVIFDSQGVPIPQPISPPAAPPRIPGVVVPPLPTIVPMLLGMDGGGGGSPQVQLPDGSMAPVRIPSVLVIPGNVGFLKQFFSAQLYVSNGAPGGTNLTVHDVTGTIQLPPGKDGVVGTSDDPLSLPATVNGPQAMTQPVLGMGPDGKPDVNILNPGDTGQAQFLIRGDQEGFYSVGFNIHASLDGLPTGTVGLSGTAMGGVLVRNPFFDMTFTVPGVVRKDEQFTLFTTITNKSLALANNLTVALDAASTSGATINGNTSQVIPTLNPGDAQLIAFKFTSQRTGKVVATYLHFDTSDGTTGQLNFSLGVDDRGVPLSPDTLVLPAAVDNLPETVVEAAMRVLGQAWGVANDPPGTLPAGVISTNTSVVTQKALALAEAGLRQSLGQPLGDALRDLTTDFWGGSPIDPGFDQLLRQSNAGQNLATVLGLNLAAPMAADGGPLPYERAISTVEASGPDFVAFAVGNGSSGAPVNVSLTDSSGNALTSTTPGGAIPGGVLLPLGTAGSSPVLGYVTAPNAPPYTLLLTPTGTGSVDIGVTLPNGSGAFTHGTISGVSVASGQPIRLIIDPTQPNNLQVAIDTAGNGSFSTTRTLGVETLQPSGPQLISANVIGPETLSQAGPFGFNGVALFDRIVDPTTAKTTSNYTVPSNAITSASPQLSGRLVFVNLQQPEGTYVPTTFAVAGINDLRGVTGPGGNVPLGSRIQDPGAVVSGRVFNADGSAASNVQVTYENWPYDPNCSSQQRSPVGLANFNTGGDGHYQFRFVRQDNCGAPFIIATNDPNTGALRTLNSYVRTAGQQIVLDVALFGRGSVTGIVSDLHGNPVSGAQVVAVSGTDPQVGGQAFTDGNGSYTISGITVGPVNVSAGMGASLGHSAGDIQRAGTTATVNVTLDGGAVNVTGVVTVLQNGVSSVLPGAPVVYSLLNPNGSSIPVGVATTGSDGSYSIKGMPTGQFSINAGLNSRDQVTVRDTGAAGDNKVENLVIVVQTNFGTVTGTVKFPNGTPAAGAIAFQGPNGVLVNPDGTYQLGGIPVEPSVSQTISAETPDGLRSGQTTVIISSPNQVFPNANITLSGVGTAQYTVIDPTGKPVSGQTVMIAGGFCNSPCGCVSGTTNSSGVVQFTGLGLGAVPGLAVLNSGSFTDVANGTATITGDGTTGFAVLQFKGSGTVTGNVLNPDSTPSFGANVTLTSNTYNPSTCQLGGGPSQSVQTDTTGHFTFKGVNVGPVSVTASQSFFPTSVGKQGTLQHNGDTVTFANVALVNTISGVLSGTVLLPDGVTAAGAGVQVTANGPLPDVTVNTDANGVYKFAKIFPEGLYTLTASDPVSGGLMRTQIYLVANQDDSMNLRLKGTGTVNVQVVDGAGQPVNAAFVTLQETGYPNASFDGAIQASTQGLISFPGIFEGNFSVQVTDPFGRGGRASAVLPQGTTSVNVTVQLTTTGTVSGHFYRADGVTPIPFGIIQLLSSGRTIGQVTTQGSGDVGSYSFDFVPAGPIRVQAQDPLTALTGVAVGQITFQDQPLTLDVIAEGLGTVTGLVTNDGMPQPGAHVEVVSGTFDASTFADATGTYVIRNAVPAGRVVVTADLGNGAFSGTSAGTLNGDGNTLTLPVALRDSGSVTGVLFRSDGKTPAPISNITIQVGGTGGGTFSTTTDSNGNFLFQRIPSGLAMLTANVLGDIDLASGSVTVPSNGNVNVTLNLNGTGSLSGVAQDSSGAPVAGTVLISGTGAFPYTLQLTAGSDGTFGVPEILAGSFTATLTVPNGSFSLYGTATGSIAPGVNTPLQIRLQSSGSVKGLVLRPDGATPAVGANVTVQIANGGSIMTQAQGDGTFTVNGIPFGAYVVSINDPLTAGLAFVRGRSITTNGEMDNVGTITLDANALSVVSTSPTDGAANVGVQQTLTASFSEALGNPNGIFVTNGANPVFLNSSLSSDGKTVSLQGTMPDGVPLVLNITTQVSDVFGRPLVQPQVVHFTTVDLTPPVVTAFSPANLTIQVPTTSSIAVTFNKALSTSALPANVITVSAGNVPVAGTSALTAPNVLTFTPAAGLATNTIYTVSVNGAVSFGGNIQTVAASSTFVSVETTPPNVVLTSPANGGFISSSEPMISFSVTDPLTGINPATAMLAIDGQAVAASVGGGTLFFTPTTPLPDGMNTVVASIQNQAGIVGTFSGSFIVDTAPPSVAVLTGITAGQVLKGQIPISASASDTISGIARINILIDGVSRASLAGPSFSGTLDTTQFPDGPHNFSAQAVNNAGGMGPASAAVQAFIENIPLSVSISSPATGAPFRNQVVVVAVPSEPVQKITFALGTQTVTATSAPYQGTLSLSGVADGSQIIAVTAFDFVGDSATSTVTIVVKQTPPPPPNGNLIFAEPPNNGVSLVHGLPGALSAGGLLVNVLDTNSSATTSATSAPDGSFATSLTDAVNDTLSLTVTDVVGNVSTPTLISVRQTPSLPPSAGNTSLMYLGNLVDRVGLTAGSLTPDGQLDAVFTLSLNIGNNITRTISYITLQGGSLIRSTQTGSTPLGVAADAGSPLINSPAGPISFPITTGATLTLFAGDGGFIQPGTTYTATAVFTDGSQFVGMFTIVAPADQQYVAHSAAITASPATVVVNGTTRGTTTLTITNIRDINGTAVPDGAMIALSATNMAAQDPTGNPIVSAGGMITDGTAAANNANFRVYTILNGTVTANYSSQPVTPAPLLGALAVVQMQAADASGNVLGTQAVATLDLNIRASTDQAIIGPVPSELYADGADRRSHFTVQVRDTSGNPVADGTSVVVSANNCASRNTNLSCILSANGTILGGQPAAAGGSFRLFTTVGGVVSGDYSSASITVPTGQIAEATLQVLPANSAGNSTSSIVMGTAQITLAGAGATELSLTPNSVPFVSPAVPVQILVHHLHDMRAGLAPDGVNIQITAASCGSRFANLSCVSSDQGTILDGNASPNGGSFRVFTIANGQAVATYSVAGATAPSTGQSAIANIQVLMADQNGAQIGNREVSFAPLVVLAPGNAVGFAQPASVLADGGLHISTVTFSPILDAFGNPIPDGSSVVASAGDCAGRHPDLSCISSAQGQVLNGSPSPSGGGFKVLPVQSGQVVVSYGDQNVGSVPGQIQTANVVLLPADSNGAVLNIIAFGIVPVSVAGLTSATGTASPAAVHADGGDHRSTITITHLKDAAGQPVPDGTMVAAAAGDCFTRHPDFSCNSSAGGQIVGSNPAPFNGAFQLLTVSNGQVVFQYTSQGVSVSTGESTALVQLLPVTPQGNEVNGNIVAIATVPVQLLSPGSAMATATPSDVFSDGGDHRSQVVFTGLLDADGVTPVPDGAKVALTAGNCVARHQDFSCILSVGGTLLSAGTTPGDGTPSPSNGSFSVFTVAGGQVRAVYSDSSFASTVNQTQVASVAAAPADVNGNVLTIASFAAATIQLRGATSAVASGPATLSLAGGTGTVTFSGIKDSVGNTVPDGTVVAVTTGNCITRDVNFNCNLSVGGTLVDGTTSSSNAAYKTYTVTNGSVTVTYSTAGASVGTATVQLAPARPDTSVIANTSLIGGTWAITVTN
jgi:hypothetical protein